MGSIINPNEKQTWAITAQGITVMGKTKSYNTYEEMLRSPDPGLINYVMDASGDPTVNTGFAVYRYQNGIFTKIYEGEMMDPDLGMIFEWSKIVNGPKAAVADIDAAAEKCKQFTFNTDESGLVNGLLVNGILLATNEQITVLEGKVSGALHFKGVVENKEALPTENNAQGDVYVDKAGKEYVFVEGVGFEEFGSITDLTAYYTKEEMATVLAGYLPLTNGKFNLKDYAMEADMIPFYQTFQNATDPAPRKTIQLANHDTISGIMTDGSGVNIAMVSKWDKVDLGSATIQMNLNSLDGKVQVNDEAIVLTDKNFTELITVEKYDDTAVKQLITDEATAREEADAAIRTELNGEAAARQEGDDALDAKISEVDAKFATKQDVITVDGQTLTLENNTLALGADVVVMANPWDASQPNRRHIVLKNHDSIVGTMTTGDNGTLIMMSKWDKVDIGTTKAQMNLNSPNGVIQVNDNAVVVTSENIGEYAPVTDLSGYYTKVEVDQKIAGVLTYKGTVATVADLDAIEAPAVGDVYHVTEDGSEYAYNGTAWEALGSEVDLSAYAKSADVTAAITVAKEEIAEASAAEIVDRKAADTALDNRIATIEDDYATKADVDAVKVNLGSNTPNVFVITNSDGTIKASEYKMGGSVFADVPNANTAASETAVVNSLSGKVDKVEGKSLVDDTEITRLADVVNYDDTEVKAAIELKQNKLAGSEFVTIENDTVALTDMVTTYVHPAGDVVRKHILLNNHDSIIGKLADGSDNATLIMLSKWDKVDVGSPKVTMNLNTVDHVTINDTDVVATDKDLAVISGKVDTVSGNVISTNDRLAALEAQIVALKQTDVAAVVDAVDLVQADKDLIITIAEPITGTTTVEGKSIEVKQLTANNATTVFKTEGDVTMKNLTTTGDLPKATANAQVRIVSGDYVRITDSTIDQTGYNAIEIGLGTGSGPSATKSIVIDNVKFNSALSNNAISIFATEDGSVVTISNCTFKKCSNPVRLSNATGGKVTINLVNCEFTEWDSSNDWAGLLIMQDYTSKSVEAVQANNLFGPDKVTINLINCTHAGKKITMPEDIATVCGTNDAATQLFYIWSNEEGLVAYDADRYPVINIQ